MLVNEEIADILRMHFLCSFTWWMADNVDHNPCKGSLHAMAVISATIAQDVERTATSFTMPAETQKVADVAKYKAVTIM